mmetsp:Transcript_10991/g.16545  ORF Transcript_10991/g.16545 Transcript_10991/m.16545 type:complete len:222 (+) Transcript_10991:207-872(+)
MLSGVLSTFLLMVDDDSGCSINTGSSLRYTTTVTSAVVNTATQSLYNPGIRIKILVVYLLHTIAFGAAFRTCESHGTQPSRSVTSPMTGSLLVHKNLAPCSSPAIRTRSEFNSFSRVCNSDFETHSDTDLRNNFICFSVFCKLSCMIVMNCSFTARCPSDISDLSLKVRSPIASCQSIACDTLTLLLVFLTASSTIFNRCVISSTCLVKSCCKFRTDCGED